MSLFTPSRRWQPAFFPFKREKFGRRLLARTELLIKGPLFGCRMCGNCLLQETAFICPMECPKGIRNGPCGGITPDLRCYVDETRVCIWSSIYKRALRKGRLDLLLEVLPPLDWDKAGTETWAEVAKRVKKTGTLKFIRARINGSMSERTGTWDSVFRYIRQPEWWGGDSEYHPPVSDQPVSDFERRLRKGEFVVATEITPPLSADGEKLTSDIENVKPYVTAINFTDASSANPKMSGIACCKVAYDLGAEPVYQIAARDTTRTGLQSNAIGAGQMGIRNILCVTGDNPRIGPSPVGSMNLVDVDSVQMLWILRRMRDKGIYLDGRKIKKAPEYFLGAATSPFALPPDLQAIRDQKKVNAGAQFFQTNIIFDPEKLDPWLEELEKRDVLKKVFILVGVTPLRSYKTALYLHTKVPGVQLPDSILDRMKKAGNNACEEGIEIALDIIEKIKKKPGINGIHLMTLGWESVTERIIRDSGLLKQKPL